MWLAYVRRNQRKRSEVDEGKDLANNKKTKPSRILTRLQDSLLIAGMLRLLSSVLRTLTASYSSDTVVALAISGMVLHVLSNDYKYANGHSENYAIPKGGINMINLEQARPSFSSGTVSMNFSFLVAALLTSRLQSEFASYLCFIKTVVLFAYYPVARHAVAFTYGDRADILTLITTLGLSYSTFYLLRDGLEVQVFFGVLLFIMAVSPIWKCWLMRHKKSISGPWDIAHVVVEE